MSKLINFPIDGIHQTILDSYIDYLEDESEIPENVTPEMVDAEIMPLRELLRVSRMNLNRPDLDYYPNRFFVLYTLNAITGKIMGMIKNLDDNTSTFRKD